MSRRRTPRIPSRHLHAATAVVLSIATVMIVAAAAGRPALRTIAHGLGLDQDSIPTWSCPASAGQPPHRRVLVLYDGAGKYAGYSAQSGVLAANLASRFGRPVRQPVGSYRAGELARYAAVIYVGTSDSARLPAGFLADVRSGTRPVLWLGTGAAALTSAAFGRSHGWVSGPGSAGRFTAVRYHGASLAVGETSLTGITVLDPAKAAVLATAVTSRGGSVPWAVRSGNLTYVAEAPLAAAGAADRSLAVADLVGGLFGPRAGRHLATIELQGVGPTSDPARLRRAADVLASRGIPFAVAVSPVYVGPAGTQPRQRITLAQRPAVAEAIRYMLSSGGTEVLQGYTDQLGSLPNPNTGQSGDDYEFLRVRFDAGRQPVYSSPAPRDPAGWTRHRIGLALAAIRAAGLPRPALWQFPDGGATPAGYQVASRMFVARYGPASYPQPSRDGASLRSLTAQAPPYLVRDVYGGPVLPETLGSVAGQGPAKGPGSVRAVLAAAATQKTALADNVAGVSYYPYAGTGPLQRLVSGLAAEGYRFASSCAVLKG